MRIEVVNEEEKGKFGLQALIQPFERPPGGVVGSAEKFPGYDLAFPESVADKDIGLGKIRIEMAKALIETETTREHVRTHHRGGLVTRPSQNFGQGLEFGREGPAILGHAVGDGSQGGEKARVARARGRRGRVGGLEAHSLVGQGAERRRGIALVAIRREVIGPGRVHGDEHDIGARIPAAQFRRVGPAGQPEAQA